MAVLTRYQKTVAAVVTGVLGWGAVAVASVPGRITSAEWLGLGIALATALNVYAVPNDPPAGEPADPDVSERGPVTRPKK